MHFTPLSFHSRQASAKRDASLCRLWLGQTQRLTGKHYDVRYKLIKTSPIGWWANAAWYHIMAITTIKVSHNCWLRQTYLKESN